LNELHEAAASDLSAPVLYGILKLRAEVFVVEQTCVYLDPDGRDLESTTRHLWVADGGVVIAALRVLSEGEGSSIGRVATAASHRRRGFAADLIERALIDAPRPVTLNAQSRLVDYYARFGFEVSGPEFVEDEIPHTPMARAAS